jgi:soluble lytic murein transglycosylase-like protein
MRIATHLTIPDYFKPRANSCFLPERCDRVEMDTDSQGSAISFSRTLAKAQATTENNARGLSIQDYMQRRICSRRSASFAKIPSATQYASPNISSWAAPKPDQGVLPHTENLNLNTAPPVTQSSFDDTDAAVKRKIMASIEQAATRFGLPMALIQAVVKAESNYQVRAQSPAGAQGLMQLMPATAKELGVTDPFDIDQNIRGGAQYLRNMLDQFDGNVHLALSAYNAGPGTVAKYAGNVPYAETQTYVQRVLHYAEQFSSPEVT